MIIAYSPAYFNQLQYPHICQAENIFNKINANINRHILIYEANQFTRH